MANVQIDIWHCNGSVHSGEVDGGTLLTLSGDNTNGYTATFRVNLPITGL
jgi:hypothetical protein